VRACCALTTERNATATAFCTASRVNLRRREAREDTVLFPALRPIVSKNEFAALGEDFEKKEHQLFGEDGFEKWNRVVLKVANGLPCSTGA